MPALPACKANGLLAASFLANHGRLALLTSAAQVPASLAPKTKTTNEKVRAEKIEWGIKCVPKSHKRVLAIGSRY